MQICRERVVCSLLLVCCCLVSQAAAFYSGLRSADTWWHEVVSTDSLDNCSFVAKSKGTQIQCGDKIFQEDEGPQFLTGKEWADILCCVLLVIMAGLMSGLTMGLMSMEPMHLKILAKSSPDEQNRKYAKRILPLVKRHHLLLVTLLLSNAVCMEALPVFLDHILGPVGAIVISTTAVLAFGEIIPQAICTRYGLAIGANTYWFVWGLMALLSPIAWPISLLLDCILGTEDEGLYRRAELKELVGYHGIGDDDSDDDNSEDDPDDDELNSNFGARLGSQRHSSEELAGRSSDELIVPFGSTSGRSLASERRTSDTSKKVRSMQDPRGEKLSKDEVRIIKGALDLRDKTIIGSMTPIEKVFTLPITSKLDEDVLKQIFEAGHSRIPIWREDEDDLIGMIHIKQLILLSPQLALPMTSLHIHRTPMVPASMSLFQLLSIFQTGRSHLAIVVNPRDHITPIGIITLEDVIEELIQGEILDESDRFRQGQPPVVPPLSLPQLSPRLNSTTATTATNPTTTVATTTNPQEPTDISSARRRARSYSTSNHPFLSTTYTPNPAQGPAQSDPFGSLTTPLRTSSNSLMHDFGLPAAEDASSPASVSVFNTKQPPSPEPISLLQESGDSGRSSRS